MSAEAIATLFMLVVTAALLGYSLWRVRQLMAMLNLADAAVARADAAAQQQAQRLAALETLRDAQQTAEQALHTGGSIVREVHKGIASIPFDILEALPGARAPTRAVRDIHDRITDGVYDALGGLNKAVGRELRKGMKLDTAREASPRTMDDETPSSPEHNPDRPLER